MSSTLGLSLACIHFKIIQRENALTTYSGGWEAKDLWDQYNRDIDRCFSFSFEQIKIGLGIKWKTVQ